MPSLTRRKPISGKQKKQELKDKRAEKLKKDLAPQGESDQPRTDPDNFYLKFINDSDKVVQQNKELAYERFNFSTPRFNIQQSIYMRPECCPALPRRPDWKGLSAQDYKLREKETFRQYFLSVSPDLRTIATDFCMFEMNEKVYTELWRVCERSDVICLLTDARFPLAHLPCNIVQFIKAISKPAIVLINKADLVSEFQIQQWTAFLRCYMRANGVACHVIPFSAQILQQEEETRLKFLSELITKARVLAARQPPDLLTIGFIGQPSVGKSRTLNAILGKKVCRVKLTAGCTKHLQTHYLDESDVGQLADETARSIMLCDCPGLVFPIRGTPRPLQVATGVFPTGRTREFYSSTQLVCEGFHGVHKVICSGVNLATIRAQHNIDERQCQLNSAGDILDILAFQMNYLVKGGHPWAHRAGLSLFKKITEGSIPYEVPVDLQTAKLVDPDWEARNFDQFSKVSKAQSLFRFVADEEDSALEEGWELSQEAHESDVEDE